MFFPGYLTGFLFRISTISSSPLEASIWGDHRLAKDAVHIHRHASRRALVHADYSGPNHLSDARREYGR